MNYAELYWMVDGCVEEETELRDETLIAEYLADAQEDSQSSGYRIDVYRIDHAHESGIECECIQFVNDHSPYRTFGPTDPPMVCGGTGNHENQPVKACDECDPTLGAE